jgi:L-fuconolactonase
MTAPTAGAAVIDAHHHLWDPARAAYPWMTQTLAPIIRRFDVADLAPLLLAAGVDGTIVVQARHGLDESRELLATAGATPFIAGVIAWVDLTDPGVGDTIAALRDGPGGHRLVGIRHQVHDEPDPEWLSRDDVRRGLEAVHSAGLAYDLLIRPREFPAALAAVGDLPDLPFVLDHLAKPPLRGGAPAPWASGLRSFAARPNVSCKLSGLVTEADWATWSVAALAPFVDEALTDFGPERLLFGSDWPVCLLAASYEDVIRAAHELTASLSPAEQAAVFGGTARRVYSLREPA